MFAALSMPATIDDNSRVDTAHSVAAIEKRFHEEFVHELFPLYQAGRIFQSMGLRHLVVIDSSFRKDVEPSQQPPFSA